MIVQAITVPANNIILTYLLKPGALAWAGFPDVDSNIFRLNILYWCYCCLSSNFGNGIR